MAAEIHKSQRGMEGSETKGRMEPIRTKKVGAGGLRFC